PCLTSVKGPLSRVAIFGARIDVRIDRLRRRERSGNECEVEDEFRIERDTWPWSGAAAGGSLAANLCGTQAQGGSRARELLRLQCGLLRRTVALGRRTVERQRNPLPRMRAAAPPSAGRDAHPA